MSDGATRGVSSGRFPSNTQTGLPIFTPSSGVSGVTSCPSVTRRADDSAAACPLASAVSLSVSLWSSNRLNAATPISECERDGTDDGEQQARTDADAEPLAPHRNE